MSLDESSSERAYTTKHGTTATMNTTNIGNRRNLTPMQRVELVIKLEPLLTAKAKAQQGARNDIPKKSAECFKPMETREELAKLSGVSRRVEVTKRAKKPLKNRVCQI